MKLTRAYIQKRIDEEVAKSDNGRHVLVRIPNGVPAREYILSYDPVNRKITGVVERISRYKCRPVSVSDILK